MAICWLSGLKSELLFVISGILAGGIPGFRMELCCFSHWCVLCLFRCFSCAGPFSEWHIRCHHACNSHCWLRSPLSVVFVWFWFWLCVFPVFAVLFLVCSFVFLFSCWDSFWTAYWSTTGTFVAFDKVTAPHVNYNSTVCREWMCVTTWRKPWRRWTEKKGLKSELVKDLCTIQ